MADAGSSIDVAKAIGDPLATLGALTRALLRRGLELGAWWPYLLALFSAIGWGALRLAKGMTSSRIG